jgi:predicted Zn-dependent protease with MMP-like domain
LAIIDFATDNHKLAPFKREKKVGCAVASRRYARQIFGVNFNWENLCAVATKEIEATLEELPKPLRNHAARLPVALERIPNAGLQADGIAADTLGLFTGAEFVDEEMISMPPQVILFLENIWELAEGDEEIFCDEIRKTFLHELGHYFGLDEADLTQRGLE